MASEADGLIGGLIPHEDYEVYCRRHSPFFRFEDGLRTVQIELETDRLLNLEVPDVVDFEEDQPTDYLHPLKAFETVVKLGVDAAQVSKSGLTSIINQIRK